MSISFITSISKQGDANGTGSSNTFTSSGGDFIAFAQCYLSGTSVTITDSKGNSYTSDKANDNTITVQELLSTIAPTVGTNHSVGTGGIGSFAALAASVFSGVKQSSPLDQTNGNSVSGTTSGQPGSVTPSEDNELVVSTAGDAWAPTLTIDSPNTMREALALIGGTSFAISIADEIQTSATTTNPTFTQTGGSPTRINMVIATYKAAAAAAAASADTLMLMGV